MVILTLLGFVDEGGPRAPNLVPIASVIGLLGSSSIIGASNCAGGGVEKSKPWQLSISFIKHHSSFEPEHPKHLFKSQPPGFGVGLWVVGALVGARVGLWVGAKVGLGVGAAVGDWVGAAVGWVVGDWVGARVGDWVGEAVGWVVGDWVGAAVGWVVGGFVPS